MLNYISPVHPGYEVDTAADPAVGRLGMMWGRMAVPLPRESFRDGVFMLLVH